jgi:hypothetical protein
MSISSEKATVEKMIRLYCRLKHKQKHLCGDCKALNEYAQRKLDDCCFGDSKPACKKCIVHCYTPQKREKIKEIMRFSGPKMLFYYPLDVIKHSLRRVK